MGMCVFVCVMWGRAEPPPLGLARSYHMRGTGFWVVKRQPVRLFVALHILRVHYRRAV